MRKVYEQKQLAFRQINDLFNDNLPLVSSNNYLTTLHVQLNGHIVTIKDISTQLKSINPKPASNKKLCRNNLEKQTLKFGSVLYSYADKIGDLDLQNTLFTASYKLKKLRHLDFQHYASSLVINLEKHQEGLADLGISPEQVTSYKTLVQEFIDIMLEPKERIDKEKEMNKKIETEIDLAFDLLKKIDLLIQVFPEESDFVRAYRNARDIRKTAVQHKEKEDEENKE